MIKVFSNYHDANDKLIQTWQNIIFLTPRWWIGIFLGIFPWLLWWKFHNKKFTGDLLRTGLFISTLALTLDSLGVQQGLWIYPYDVFPFIPGYFPWDLTLLPITTMLMVEIKPHWSPILKAIIFAFLSAFIGEPLATVANLYEPIHWKPYYSFPIYIFLFLASNFIAKSKIFNSHLNFDR
ncbi:hypothetical protein WQ57_01855 [Mesobacillus campisalis]|uniref:Uncharacterized protein n=2 Tax=Mesobacillus campisalis TaxID=1408103 RepID=A0A0M2T293_9BACI|nr:hypothetical protein WQ57_01855 [Mesobacillus campisalis]